MIAETLLLLNDDPSKPLNRHFNDSLVDLKNWLSNAIQYIESDNVLKIIFSYGSSSNNPTILKHSGTLKINVGKVITSGTANSVQIYINDSLITTLSSLDTGIISVNAGDVLTVKIKAGGMIPEYVHLCGFPILLDL